MNLQTLPFAQHHVIPVQTQHMTTRVIVTQTSISTNIEEGKTKGEIIRTWLTKDETDTDFISAGTW
jgi:hypothetical protein